MEEEEEEAREVIVKAEDREGRELLFYLEGRSRRSKDVKGRRSKRGINESRI